MDSNQERENQQTAIALQRRERPVWVTPTVSFVAAILGTSLTLLAGSRFHEGGIAEELTPEAIGEPATVPEQPETSVVLSELSLSPPDDFSQVLGDLRSRLTPVSPPPPPAFPTPPALSESVDLGEVKAVRDDVPLVEVPPPIEGGSHNLEVAPRQVQKQEIPTQDSVEEEAEEAIALQEAEVAEPVSSPGVGDRQRELATLPLFENRPEEVEEVSPRRLEFLSPELEGPEGIPLTLVEVVGLAVQNNREIKNAYLQRIAQREDLAVALDKFQPIFTPEVGVFLNRDESGSGTTNSAEVSAGSVVSMRIPTGGEIRATWNTGGIAQSSNRGEINDLDRVNQALQLTFSQPLLRGYGTEINTASIKIAQLTETINQLGLQSTLINIVTDAVLGYRQLLQAQEAVKIAQSSLRIAQEVFEINRVLVEAGRQARIDLVQNERIIANLQVQLLRSENNFERVRLELIQILDVDDFQIIPAEEIVVEDTQLNEAELTQLALANRADYLNAQLEVEIAALNLRLAEDNMRWDVDLNASYGNGLRSRRADENDVRLGVSLRRDFGDRNLEREVKQRQVTLLQAQNNQADQRDNLLIQVSDRVRNANLLREQVDLAQQEREFAEQNLENQRELLRLGRGSIRDLIRAQEDVVSANNDELNAQIDYLNALTRLEQSVGITLETWQITVETPEE